MGAYLGRGRSGTQARKGPGLAPGSSVGCRGLALSQHPLTLAPNPLSSSLSPAQWWGCPALGPPRKSFVLWKVRARVRTLGPRPMRSTTTLAQVGSHTCPTAVQRACPLLAQPPLPGSPREAVRRFQGRRLCGLLA